MKEAGDAFAGAGFHCYGGKVQQQSDFHKKYPKKEIYHTECTSMMKDKDWWSNIQVSLFFETPMDY